MQLNQYKNMWSVALATFIYLLIDFLFYHF